MAREKKCRSVCRAFNESVFTCENSLDTVNISVEELEAMRLLDIEMLSQDKAATKMNISRGTIQRLIYDAHQKVADALINGNSIRIGGGFYRVSDKCVSSCCECQICVKKRGNENE